MLYNFFITFRSDIFELIVIIAVLVPLYMINRKLSVLIEQGKEKPGQDTAPPKEEGSTDRMEE